MKTGYPVFLALLISAPLRAYSADLLIKDYDPAEGRCRYADDASLQGITATLNDADKVLPNIPPEEDRYLTAESAAAQQVYEDELEKNNWKTPINGQANRRYAALEARPLYTVWGVRKDLGKAKLAISEILKPELGNHMVTYRNNPEAEKLDVATSAIYSVSAYALSMRDFLTKQPLGTNSAMITSDQYTALYSGILDLNSSLGRYMSCKLAKIMGRQSFQ